MLTQWPLLLDGELIGLEADLGTQRLGGLVRLDGHLVLDGGVFEAHGALGPRRLALPAVTVRGLVAGQTGLAAELLW